MESGIKNSHRTNRPAEHLSAGTPDASADGAQAGSCVGSVYHAPVAPSW
jgi:hypothetical protein